ncbi:MAG: hypothetical protein M3290_05050 [Actinomycetota bacterium]|nr:hypothetical protein [Actinomycetota bacterium]
MHRVSRIHTPKVSAPSGEAEDERPIILFVCRHNAGKSLVAEALLERLAGDRYAARSAGPEPSPKPHPEVVEAMREEGIELAADPGTLLTQELADSAALIVSMGCDVSETCRVTSTEIEDWVLENGKGKSPEEVADMRDEIEMKVRNLVARLDRETFSA